jgi:hypothetical protein
MNPRYRPLVALAAAGLFVGAVLRVTLWWQFGVADGVPGRELPSILLRGLANDAVVMLYALTPLALYLGLLPGRWLRSRAHRWLVGAACWTTLFAMVFVAVVERYFFQEFDARFNLVACDYLAYPTEVAGDVWSEYPVVRAVIAAALLASAGLYAMRAWIPGRPASLRGT